MAWMTSTPPPVSLPHLFSSGAHSAREVHLESVPLPGPVSQPVPMFLPGTPSSASLWALLWFWPCASAGVVNPFFLISSPLASPNSTFLSFLAKKWHPFSGKNSQIAGKPPHDHLEPARL